MLRHGSDSKLGGSGFRGRCALRTRWPSNKQWVRLEVIHILLQFESLHFLKLVRVFPSAVVTTNRELVGDMLERESRKSISKLVMAKGAILSEIDRLGPNCSDEARRALEEALNNIDVLFEEGAA